MLRKFNLLNKFKIKFFVITVNWAIPLKCLIKIIKHIIYWKKYHLLHNKLEMDKINVMKIFVEIFLLQKITKQISLNLKKEVMEK